MILIEQQGYKHWYRFIMSTMKHTFIFWAGPGAIGAANVLNMTTAVLGAAVVPPLLCHF